MRTDRCTTEPPAAGIPNGRPATLSERARQARRDYLERSYRSLLESCAERNPERPRPWGESVAPAPVESRSSLGGYWRAAAAVAVIALIVMNAPGGSGPAKNTAPEASLPASPALLPQPLAAIAIGAEPAASGQPGAPEGDTVPTAYLPKKP